MNILFLGANVFDRDQIASTVEHEGFARLTFKNGDILKLAWRDEFERRDILSSLPESTAASHLL